MRGGGSLPLRWAWIVGDVITDCGFDHGGGLTMTPILSVVR